MNQAYRSRSHSSAKKQLENLARSLQAKYPGAAASLREGLDETLTVIGLGLSRTLERSFATTNPSRTSTAPRATSAAASSAGVEAR
jgi:transposase-like protein